MIGSHRKELDKIAEYLIRRETITGKEFMKIFHAVQLGMEIPENLDDLDLPEENKESDKKDTVTPVSLEKTVPDTEPITEPILHPEDETEEKPGPEA